jgi:hypothetical protein
MGKFVCTAESDVLIDHNTNVVNNFIEKDEKGS